MGYNTNFDGQFDLNKPLSIEDHEFLTKFSENAHEYGCWCNWVPNEFGTAIVWDGNERFYDYIKWINYLIKSILEPRGYSLTGYVKWHGDEPDDFGIISIENNVVRIGQGLRSYIYS